MRSILTWWLLLLAFQPVLAQQLSSSRPKLVVGIVVDQMRWDFLYRYSNRYGAGGFNRLLKEGFSCENALIDYTPTYTAPGHAAVYTGSVPSLHGIIGNSWFSREKNGFVYCTDDDSVRTIGSSSDRGKMSPKNLWSNTITDELKLAQHFKSKTIAIALKDRGSIIPGGHTADAAYWFDNASGGWVTSSYYMEQLPPWVSAFNAKRWPDSFLVKNWNPLYPIGTYTQTSSDSSPYEDILPGEDNDFEHRTDHILANKYETFRYIPGANTYVFDMGRAAIENEGLGKRGVTDFLALSFSSTDYAGHRFGPNSIEMEDMYLRLDRDMAAFLQYLDKKIGKGQYLVFLTADHGVAHIPGYAIEHKMPAGFEDDQGLKQILREAIRADHGIDDAVMTVINYQVYLNHPKIGADKFQAVKQTVTRRLRQLPFISHVIDLEQIPGAGLPFKLENMVRNGYNQKLSGDLQFVFRPQWFDGFSKGTTHGAWNPYDAHLPLVWFGWKIKAGKTYREVHTSDIAPTLAALLQIQVPNASIGEAIGEVVR